MEIRVLTFNIHHGKGTDKKVDLKRVIEVIRRTDADIIGLNEVDYYFSKRSAFADQSQSMAKELGMNYIFGPSVTLKGQYGKQERAFGNALITRFQVLESINHPFNQVPKIFEGRSLLEAKLKVGNSELTTFVTHLSLGPYLQKKQVKFVVGKMQSTKGPALVMGDWNMTPLSQNWKMVTKELQDAWAVSKHGKGGGSTFPSKRPFRRLDYIFTSKDFEIIHTEVVTINRETSDHLPLLAIMRFKSE